MRRHKNSNKFTDHRFDSSVTHRLRAERRANCVNIFTAGTKDPSIRTRILAFTKYEKATEREVHDADRCNSEHHILSTRPCIAPLLAVAHASQLHTVMIPGYLRIISCTLVTSAIGSVPRKVDAGAARADATVEAVLSQAAGWTQVAKAATTLNKVNICTGKVSILQASVKPNMKSSAHGHDTIFCKDMHTVITPQTSRKTSVEKTGNASNLSR